METSVSPSTSTVQDIRWLDHFGMMVDDIGDQYVEARYPNRHYSVNRAQ